jgi:2-dehydro-3-deoxygluconokinase
MIGQPTSHSFPEAVCLGESMAVLVPDRPGTLDTVESFRVAVGGAESNVACGLAGLGISSAWVSRVGADGFGTRLTADLAACGVDVSAVAVDPARPTGMYVKELGENSRMHYYRTGSAASALSPALLEDPAAARLLLRARLWHLTGITPALSDSCLGLVRTLLKLRTPGRLISFDLNWRPALWRDRDPAVLRDLMDAADILLLGADEAELAFGVGDPHELRAMFPSPTTVVVKDSGHQVTALRRDGGTVTERALAVEVVEATGAGDGFAAGYLAATLRGLDQRARLRLGHLTAAAALTTRGDHGEALPEDVLTALLNASPQDWAATRVTALGVHSPTLTHTS